MQIGEVVRAIREVDSFSVVLDRGCLLRGSELIELRPKAFDVITYLAARAGRLVRKQELLEAVWTNVDVTDDSLVLVIRELRHHLDDNDQCLIKTVPRRC